MGLYHTYTEGPDREALKYGVKAIIELAKENSNIAYIATHNKNNVRDSFTETFGRKLINAFLKTGHMKMLDVDIYLQTERKVALHSDKGPVLSSYNSLQFTRGLLIDQKNTDLVYIPWLPEELDEYLREHPESREIYRGE